PNFTMFDFVGVTDVHGDDGDMPEGGIIMAQKPAKKTPEPRRLLSLDVEDHIDPTTRAWITIHENGNMVFPAASEQKAGELGARFEAWLLEQPNLTPDQDRWLRMIGNQIRANADDLDEFTAGHFAFHPFTLLGGVPEAIRVFGGESALDLRLEALNAAVFKGGEPGAAPAAGPPPAT